MLGHGVGRIGRHAGHLDAALLRRLQIHVVEPGAAQQDQPHAAFLQRLHRLPGQLVVHEHAHRVVALRQIGRLRGQAAAEILDVAVVGALAPVLGQLAEEQAVVVVGAEEGDVQQAGPVPIPQLFLEHPADLVQRRPLVAALGGDFQLRALNGAQVQQLQHVGAAGGPAVILHGDLGGEVHAGLGQERRRTGVQPQRAGDFVGDGGHGGWLLA